MGLGMRRSPLFAAASLGVLVVIASVSESRPWANELPSATVAFAQSAANLSGVITDMMGGQSSAIADATGSLYSTDRILQTKSDRSGQFGFTNVPPGTYILEAAHPGFKTKKLGTIQVTEKRAGPYSITMEIATSDCGSPYSISYAGGIAGRTLRGVVLDEKQPLADAEVSLASVVGSRVVASRRSAGKGEFEFDKVEPGRYVLRVSHSGYRDEVTEPFWVVRESGTRTEIQMLKQGLIRVCQ